MNKRFFGIIIILSLLITIFIPTTCVGAVNTYSIRVGKKLQLTSTFKKPAWGSSDTSVATVSDKGVVKGKSKGKCYISAVYNGMAEVYVIKVKAAKVKEVKEKENEVPSNEVSFGGKEYTLTFSDDFDSFDTGKWGYCPQQIRQDVGGVWRDSCSKFENGNYVITCDVAANGTPISGGIRTRSKFEQTYGLYHMRFKMEKSSGLWYAFWLMTDKMSGAGNGNGAVDSAEIDILEVVPRTGEFCTTIHWDGYGWYHKKRGETTFVDDNFFGKYHEIWFLWDKDGYRLYLDGTDESCLMFDMPGKEYGDGTCAVPCYLKITAEYGTWGGDIDKSKLPALFYVDYVRVYKEK
ncbi:MAG: family 16 glycosylhydrolase [Lachnospiraceae bacterium]|nr:family 16 glycosylhydrolase [Lachnospiraceae bacterium]